MYEGVVDDSGEEIYVCFIRILARGVVEALRVCPESSMSGPISPGTYLFQLAERGLVALLEAQDARALHQFPVPAQHTKKSSRFVSPFRRKKGSSFLLMWVCGPVGLCWAAKCKKRSQ